VDLCFRLGRVQCWVAIEEPLQGAFHEDGIVSGEGVFGKEPPVRL
jgi:hypothetical protein